MLKRPLPLPPGLDSAPAVLHSFPSNMGEAGVKMTLQAFGEVVDFAAEESEDGMTLGGRIEYTEVSAAKAAIDKYDGALAIRAVAACVRVPRKSAPLTRLAVRARA